MNRPLFFLGMIFTLLFSAPLAAAPQFSDVSGHWGESYIYQTAEAGLVRGYPDGTFQPNKGITRGEFVTILAMESGEVIPDAADSKTFQDVPSSHWAAKYILWGKKNDVLSGYEDQTFRPEQRVSRQEMASLLYRYITNYQKMEIQTLKPEVIFQDDNLIADWAREAVRAMQRSAIINGKENNIFDPLSGATRAETTVMMGKYLTYYKSEWSDGVTNADIYFNNELKVTNAALQRKNNVVMISLRNLLETAGYRISYYPLPGLIVADTAKRDMELWVNNSSCYANGTLHTLSVAPYSDHNITFVPLKETATAAGLAVTLKDENGKAQLYLNGGSSIIQQGSNQFYGSAADTADVNGDIFLGNGSYGFFGTIKAGQMSYGSYTAANGDIFFGSWSNGKLNGAGRSVTSDGECYVGTFTDGVKTTGTTYFTNGGNFRGTWTKNSSGAVYPCKGRYTAADGTTYGSDETEWSYGSLSQSSW